MSRRALIIQHIAVETLGANFSAVLGAAGFELVPLAAYAGADDRVRFAAPNLADVDLIVSLGGPQSANDPVPALRREMAYLRAAATGKPQVPVVDSQDDPSVTVNKPEPVPVPSSTIPIATTAPVSGGYWQSLSKWQPVGAKPPVEIRFPDGVTTEIKHWVDIPAETARWLSNNGRLDEAQIPVQSGKRYILSGSPVHSTGTGFRLPRQAGKFYVEGNYNRASNVRNANTIIERAGTGVTPEQFSVRLP